MRYNGRPVMTKDDHGQDISQNYIHNNPVKGKWRLAENAVDYLYSSMKQYETGEKGIYEVTLLSSIECFSFL